MTGVAVAKAIVSNGVCPVALIDRFRRRLSNRKFMVTDMSGPHFQSQPSFSWTYAESGIGRVMLGTSSRFRTWVTLARLTPRKRANSARVLNSPL